MEDTYPPPAALPCPGFAINPRIPASCVKFERLPRAPERAIILIGFLRGKFANNSSAISSFTFSHSLFKWRSHSSIVNIPLRCRCLSSSAFLRPYSTCSSLFGATSISLKDTVIPATVEYLNPMDLIWSKISAV